MELKIGSNKLEDDTPKFATTTRHRMNIWSKIWGWISSYRRRMMPPRIMRHNTKLSSTNLNIRVVEHGLHHIINLAFPCTFSFVLFCLENCVLYFLLTVNWNSSFVLLFDHQIAIHKMHWRCSNRCSWFIFAFLSDLPMTLHKSQS